MDLVLNKPLEGLEKSKAAQIEAIFLPMVNGLKEFEAAYTEVMGMDQSEEKAKIAKRLRLDIKVVRINAEKTRKEQKEEFLRAGKAIDGVANIVKWAVEEKENALKEVEEFYIRLEAEKIARVQAERINELKDYDFDGSTMDLGNMAEDLYISVLNGAKANFNTIKEAERMVEEKRAADELAFKTLNARKILLAKYDRFGGIEKLTMETTEEEYKTILIYMEKAEADYEAEQEKTRLENDRLKKEAEKAEALRAKQEADRKKESEASEKKAEKERLKNEEKLRIEREAREAAEKKADDERAEVKRKEAERLRLEEEKRLETERIERERLKKEADAKKAAEMAPDREKLIQLSSWLMGKLDSFKSDKALNAVKDAALDLANAAKEL